MGKTEYLQSALDLLILKTLALGPSHGWGHPTAYPSGCRAIGFVHATVVLTLGMRQLPGLHPRMASEQQGPTVMRQLEPPGFLALSYGYQTPVAVLIAHLVYGGDSGGVLRAALRKYSGAGSDAARMSECAISSTPLMRDRSGHTELQRGEHVYDQRGSDQEHAARWRELRPGDDQHDGAADNPTGVERSGRHQRSPIRRLTPRHDHQRSGVQEHRLGSCHRVWFRTVVRCPNPPPSVRTDNASSSSRGAEGGDGWSSCRRTARTCKR